MSRTATLPEADGAQLHYRALEALYASAPVNRLFSSKLTIPEPGRSVIEFAVDDAFRGQGVGSALLEYVLAEAARNQATRCVLEVAPEAAPAIALYRRHGFEEIGRIAVEDPESGRGLEYVHMQRQMRPRPHA